ncbi:MAG: nucleoside phosphorylase [Candidatus Hadarchaeum sp.]|uniref:nucleoside phosphorylase n=1 Tax=Candidatus Hadarchaeum sp. TaxID=2883567 RepID=UPI003D0B5D2E
MNQPRTWYLHQSGALPEVAILVGDSKRLDLFAEKLKHSDTDRSHHGFALLKGTYEGIPLSVTAYGIGAPAIAVAIEELATLGAKIIVRAGTVMALSCPLGSLILAEGGVRLEGTSSSYLPIEFPAIPDPELFEGFARALSSLGVPYYLGLVASLDGLYPRKLKEEKIDVKLFHKFGVVGMDMETAAAYVVSKFLGLKAVSLCLASVEFGSFNTLAEGERRSLEELLVEATLKGIKSYFEREGW